MSRYALAALSAVVFSVFGVAEANAQVYIPPQCDMRIEGQAERIERFIKRAAEARSEEDRAEHLAEARENLFAAIEEAEEEVPALWYFLGRYYLMESDYAGADSAFDKVATLEPDCEEDTENHREMVWGELYNTGVQALQSNDLETAKSALSAAHTINPGDPTVPYYLGLAQVRLGENEAAIESFKETVAFQADTGQLLENHVGSLFNVALLYQVVSRWDSSVVWYEKYLDRRPDDTQAITSLSIAHLGRGVELFNAGDNVHAVEAFKSALDLNPFYRDALMNLAQCYLRIARPEGAQDPATLSEEALAERAAAAEEMLNTAKRLVDLDPLNRSSLRRLAAAYQINGHRDSLMAVAQHMEGLPFEVSVRAFQPAAEGFQLSGVVTNLSAETETEVPPVNIELLDFEGQVLGTETVGDTALDPGASTRFQFNPVYEDLAAWRVRVP